MREIPTLLYPIIVATELNLLMAFQSLALGIVLGILLAHIRIRRGLLAKSAGAMTGLMRASPSFIVMYFLLNLGDRDMGLFRSGVRIDGETAVVLSLTVYTVIYISDAAVPVLQDPGPGAPRVLAQLLPAVARCLFVTFLSTSAGAAIGLQEAVGTTLRQADLLPTLGQRLALYSAVIGFFATIMFAGSNLIHLLQQQIQRASPTSRHHHAAPAGIRKSGGLL